MTVGRITFAPPTLFDMAPPVTIPDTRQIVFEKAQTTRLAIQTMLVRDYFERAFCADEWATEHGISILRVRPRVAELNKLEMLHRVGYGLTIDGNQQNKFTLFPYLRNRLTTLAAEFGMDAAIGQLIAECEARKP